MPQAVFGARSREARVCSTGQVEGTCADWRPRLAYFRRRIGSARTTAICVPVCGTVFDESCRRSGNAWTFFPEKSRGPETAERQNCGQQRWMSAVKLRPQVLRAGPRSALGKPLDRRLPCVSRFRSLGTSRTAGTRVAYQLACRCSCLRGAGGMVEFSPWTGLHATCRRGSRTTAFHPAAQLRSLL